MDDNPVTDGEIALAKGQWLCARPYGERTGPDYGFYAALVNLQAQEIAVAFRVAHVKYAPPGVLVTVLSRAAMGRLVVV